MWPRRSRRELREVREVTQESRDVLREIADLILEFRATTETLERTLKELSGHDR